MTKEEALVQLRIGPGINEDVSEEYNEAVDMAIKALEQESPWIPVSEKLPEPDKYVNDVCEHNLIQDEYGDMYVAHFSKVGWIPINSTKAISGDVIAWMPLPEPYKPSN